MHATALIAEDEPLLAAHLQTELARIWPALRVLAQVGHGQAAHAQALALRPEVLFLDIRMPGMSGLEVAAALAEDWPADSGEAFPLLVFVTAYDQYALQAFDRAAVDYVLKPVQAERLAQTCTRLQEALAIRRQARPAAMPALADAISQLQSLLGSVGPAGVQSPSPGAAALRVIQAGIGNTLTMVPVDEVLYFEAADKYVRVVTREREHLIRCALRELAPQLDPGQFWQVHRSCIVRADAIATAVRDESGRLTLHLKSHPDRLQVSRMYASLFKAM